MKQAACVYIRRPDGSVALTTRRKTGSEASTYGLPGGKVDPGETPLDAAVRETREETGLDLDPRALIKVFTQVCEGEVNYETTTFFVNVPQDTQLPGGVEEGIEYSWGRIDKLLNNSPFASYNRQLLRAMRKFLRNQYTLTMGDIEVVLYADTIRDVEAIAKYDGHKTADKSTVCIGGYLKIIKFGEGETVIVERSKNASAPHVDFRVGGNEPELQEYFTSVYAALADPKVQAYRFNPEFGLVWSYNNHMNNVIVNHKEFA